MAKLNLNDIGTTLSESASGTINTNNAAIEAALENTLSRDGTAPNTMGADIDMNGNDLLNVSTIDADVVTVAGESINTFVTRAETAATNAETSEANAATSALSASTSAALAEDYALSIGGTQIERVVYTLGPTGDFTSFNEALTALKNVRVLPDPDFAQTTFYRTPAMCAVVVQSDFVMEEQVFLDGGDYSHIEFWGPDGIGNAQTTAIPITRSAITKLAPAETFYPVFYFNYCITPRIRVLFNLDTSGTGTAAETVRGMHIANCRAFINNGGITNCTERGVVVYVSEANLANTTWDGAGTIGVRLANRATANLTGVSAQNCGETGLHARGGSVMNAIGFNFSGSLGEGVILASCVLYAEDAVVSGCATNGIRAANSTVYLATPADLTNNGGFGLAAYASKVFADGTDVGGSDTGILSTKGSEVIFQNGSAIGCGSGIICEYGSFVDGTNATITGGTTQNARFAYNSRGCLRGATVSGSLGQNLNVYHASTVDAASAILTGAAGTYGVDVQNSSSVNLKGASCRKGASDSSSDVNLLEGSSVNMTGATGGWPGFPGNANAIISSRGFVWKA